MTMKTLRTTCYRMSWSFVCSKKYVRSYDHRRLRCLIIVMIAVILCFNTARAMEAGEHYDEWYAALGVSKEDSASQKVLMPLFVLMQTEVIDAEGNGRTESDLRKKLREVWDLKFNGWNHRVLFHWGFNQTCKTYLPLKGEIEKQFRSSQKMAQRHQTECPSTPLEVFLKEQRDIVIDIIEKERIRRNQKIINKTQECIGFEGTSARGFATILWDVHIMADYTKTALDGLLSSSRLFTDFTNQGIDRMGGFKGADVEAFVDALNKVQSDPVEMLKTVKLQFPSLLSKYWGETLAKRGITITPPPQ